MNLRRIDESYVDLDARLRQSDIEMLTTLDRLIDVETTLAIIKKVATGEKNASGARVKSAEAEPAP